MTATVGRIDPPRVVSHRGLEQLSSPYAGSRGRERRRSSSWAFTRCEGQGEDSLSSRVVGVCQCGPRRCVGVGAIAAGTARRAGVERGTGGLPALGRTSAARGAGEKQRQDGIFDTCDDEYDDMSAPATAMGSAIADALAIRPGRSKHRRRWTASHQGPERQHHPTRPPATRPPLRFASLTCWSRGASTPTVGPRCGDRRLRVEPAGHAVAAVRCAVTKPACPRGLCQPVSRPYAAGATAAVRTRSASGMRAWAATTSGDSARASGSIAVRDLRQGSRRSCARGPRRTGDRSRGPGD